MTKKKEKTEAENNLMSRKHGDHPHGVIKEIPKLSREEAQEIEQEGAIEARKEAKEKEIQQSKDPKIIPKGLTTRDLDPQTLKFKPERKKKNEER